MKLDIDFRVYRDGPLTHLLGPNPGTPYTMCGLDAGAMELRLHPPDIAAIWCTACMQTAARSVSAPPTAETADET